MLNYQKLIKIKKLVKKFEKTYDFDFKLWRESGYKNLEKFNCEKKYKFFLDQDQYKALNTQIDQFKSENLNTMLRNMTVYTETSQFFYNVEEIK